MKLNRRELLGSMGVALGSIFAGRAIAQAESSGTQMPEAEFSMPPKPEVELTEEPELEPVEATEHTIELRDVVEEEIPAIESFVPRTSAALERQIQERMENLRTEFGAEIIFDRALDMEHNGEPLMDTVYDTFRQRIYELPAFQNMEERSIDWMIEVCCYGEVTAESGWNTDAVGSGSDQGLWQITDQAASQPNCSRASIQYTSRPI